MGISPLLNTIGLFITHEWEQSASLPPSSSKYVTPAAVQRSLLDQIVSGVRVACDDADLQLLLYPYSVYQRMIETDLMDFPISGLILVSGFADHIVQHAVERDLPVVILNHYWEVPTGSSAVYCVEGQTVNLALSHLWGQGHSRIAYLASVGESHHDHLNRAVPQVFTSKRSLMDTFKAEGTDTAVRRLERTITWLDQRNAFDPELVAVTHDRFEDHEIRHALTRWMQMPDPPTGIFCGYEGAAIQFLEIAESLGIHVPDCLSLVGVDSNRGLMEQTNPPITSIQWPAVDLGMESVKTLLPLLQKRLLTDPEISTPMNSAVTVEDLFIGATTAERKPSSH